MAAASWVPIRDPDSGDTFYANPDSGECTWDLPAGAPLLATSDAHEIWWQLVDERSKVPYFYSTRSGVTQWPRPDGPSVVVVNLINIQKHAIGKRVSLAYGMTINLDQLTAAETTSTSGAANGTVYGSGGAAAGDSSDSSLSAYNRTRLHIPGTGDSSTASSSAGGGPALRTQITTNGSSGRGVDGGTPSPRLYNVTTPMDEHPPLSALSDNEDLMSPVDTRGSALSSSAPVLSMLHESMRAGGGGGGTGLSPTAGLSPTSRDPSPTGYLSDPPRSAGPFITTHAAAAAASGAVGPSMPNGSDAVRLPKSASVSDLKMSIGNPSNNPAAAHAMHPVHGGGHVGGAASTSVSPLLPSATVVGGVLGGMPVDLRAQLSQFRISGFAQKYFREQKRGLFRRRVPVEKLLVWTKESLRLPLMVMSKQRHKDTLKCFKVLQRAMGDRAPPRGYDRSADIQWILDRGVNAGDMRDEIYVQLCKQLTSNPNPESVRKGWDVMVCLTPAFPPSKNFQDYLKSFIFGHLPPSTGAAAGPAALERFPEITIMAAHSLRRLERSCKVGPRGKTPTTGEIDRMLRAPFEASVFGETLDDIMRSQQQSHPYLPYPRILVFLAQLVLKLQGFTTEGIFRVPGDADLITDLRLRIERNEYSDAGIVEASVPAGLLKFWLRELADPLIPTASYPACIAAADDPDRALALIDALPEYHRNVAMFVIAFLQLFARPEYMKITKMSVANLAMVFAPSFLRCPSEDPREIFENTKYEQQFLRHLIERARWEVDVQGLRWQ
ncbi:hypothetical protein BC828DRAFT_403499 [Blastocladiella britannica]|nr:hypothetical protein BC828DRAFT_403499 [Blastocladiella britannica]